MQSTNGANSRQHEGSFPAAGGLDVDQTSTDSDQFASDRDQAASDRDLAHGVPADQHEASRDVRRRTAGQRVRTDAARLESAHLRDATAQARDLAGLARDRAAAARDLAMAQRDILYEHEPARAVPGREIVIRASEQRRHAMDDRRRAADHRAQAAHDREAAATDRAQGARDRLQARADREALSHAVAISETDPLTGARTRAAGLADLDHDVDRCHRISSALVVAYVHVVGLADVNDGDGHGAGDRLLKRVVAIITDHLRGYDPIIRLGGDEFLCAMSDMGLDDARERFSTIACALAGSSEAGAIRTGFAELTPDATAAELIARAAGERMVSRRDGRTVATRSSLGSGQPGRGLPTRG